MNSWFWTRHHVWRRANACRLAVLDQRRREARLAMAFVVGGVFVRLVAIEDAVTP